MTWKKLLQLHMLQLELGLSVDPIIHSPGYQTNMQFCMAEQIGFICWAIAEHRGGNFSIKSGKNVD